VISADFDESTNKWTVCCDDGKVFRASYFIAAIGFAAKRHFPDWKGLDSFKGIIHHSSFWPADLDVRGKKMAVIGTGATGVQVSSRLGDFRRALWLMERQIAQECAKEAGDLTVFVRTPNIACPMQQAAVSWEQQAKDKLSYTEMFKERLTTDGGFGYSNRGFPHSNHNEEEREALFEELWQLVNSLPSTTPKRLNNQVSRVVSVS
jgi:cation diffusion facilitator CzcD-associated flavoprotein CzcO